MAQKGNPIRIGESTKELGGKEPVDVGCAAALFAQTLGCQTLVYLRHHAIIIE
jgi:hypothetical protein